MKKFCTIFLLGLAFICVSAAQEPLARPLNLAELTDHAGTIVHARVISAVMEPHPQFPNINTMKVTVQVLETLQGKRSRQLSFREYSPFEGLNGKRISNMRNTFRSGEELVLFLYPPSKAAFTSAVGGGQGHFEVAHTASGDVVMNAQRNRGLFAGVDQAAADRGVQMSAAEQKMLRSEGPAELSSFKQMVRQLAARRAQ